MLQDKVALVTGTSPNIGGGIAEALAKAGAAVVAVDARAENATDCARYIESTGGRAIGITADVTDEAQVESAVASAAETFGSGSSRPRLSLAAHSCSPGTSPGE
jgi:NAD(P)-dependent dehydrogenase (short-subunit alcohol dehydrogenase family)